MSIERRLFIAEQLGPDREPNGPQRKPAIYPKELLPDREILRSELAWAVDWQEARWAADHGSHEDHERLLTLLNYFFKRDDLA